MADLGTEPSMEDILSSIKRIIAEEGDAFPPRRSRAKVSVAEPEAGDREEILELNDPIDSSARTETDQQESAPAIAETRRETLPDPTPRADPMNSNSPVDPILSRRAEDATRGSLAALTRMVVKPEPGSDGTLEGLVRDMLRPMLSGWLDENLPAIVERMVAQEIERISGKGGNQAG